MTKEEIIEEIRVKLSGNLLTLEVSDETIGDAIKIALRKLNRYFDESTMITVPYAKCIDLRGKEFEEHVRYIVNVYRAEGQGNVTGAGNSTDPLYMQQWAIFSNGGTMFNICDYIANYGSWMTMLQIKNTMSTDMSFREDTHNKKLYINSGSAGAKMIAIEYVPRLNSPEEIQSDYWIDILISLATAITKTMIGRVRTRYTVTNAQWTQDGEKILEEGNTELKELEEKLSVSANIVYPID